MDALDYSRTLGAALKAGTEMAMQRFLETHWRPLLVEYSHGSNGFLIVPQFRFGRDYRADFLVLSAQSGAWHAVMVELESPSSALYLCDGTESRTLRIAIRQVSDWDDWVEADPLRFRKEIASELKRAFTPVKGAKVIARRIARTDILDTDMYLARHYSVVIGRRSTLSPEDRRRRSQMARRIRGLEIATYDRFVDISDSDARRLAAWKAFPK